MFPNRGIYKKFFDYARSFVVMGVYSKDTFELIIFKLMVEDDMKEFINDHELERVYNAVSSI